ncbi:MAG TPA: hypothetical protein VG674_11690 [Amycolatopsis sp.]|jgi:hypothetical protein|nr:hypothetical protein [Amycolatopsis sp.]
MGLWDDAEFAIMGSAGAGPASGGGFMLQRDEAEDLVKRLMAVRGQLVEMQARVEELCKITPPSRDPGSLAYQQALTVDKNGNPAALSYGGGHIDLQLAYVEELINRLNTALGKIQTGDEQQAGSIQSAAGQSEGRI